MRNPCISLLSLALALISCSDPGERTLDFDQNGIYATTEDSSSSSNTLSSSSIAGSSSSTTASSSNIVGSSSSAHVSSSSISASSSSSNTADVKVSAGFSSTSYKLGGAKSATPSCLNLDGSALYTSTQLTNTPANKSLVDVIFSGSAIMTPYGTSEQGYMKEPFLGIDNRASFIPISTTQAAQLKAANATVAMLEDMIDPAKAVFSATINAGEAFIVISDQGVPFVIIADALDTTFQLLTLQVLQEAK